MWEVPVDWPTDSSTWFWVGMDITHYQGRYYLSLIDCGPTQFSILRHLRCQDAASVINHLEGLFCMHGMPAEIFMNNDTAFCSKLFGDFLSEWGVQLHFHCAHVPSSNDITELCHWSVKRIAAKKHCLILEAIYWYNVTPEDNVSLLTIPANLIHRYWVWLKGIDVLPPDEPKQLQIGYYICDRIWIKTSNDRCMSPYAYGHVTGVIRLQNVIVDGMSCHVRDFHLLMGLNTLKSESDSELSTQSARTIIINGTCSDPP